MRKSSSAWKICSDVLIVSSIVHVDTRIMSRVRGPCTPLTLVISISAVADGPAIVVSGKVAKDLIFWTPAGTVSTT